jgi:hypothetical protein
MYIKRMRGEPGLYHASVLQEGCRCKTISPGMVSGNGF